MRICAIDIGSNSARCLVADVAPGGIISPIERSLEITRLGEGIGTQQTISPEAAERTAATVAKYMEMGRRARAVNFLLFGTAILREAKNAQSFIDRVREKTGYEIRVLSGEEEAEFIYRGVTRTISPPPTDALVIDIGGGSAEFVAPATKGNLTLKSIPLGCVRMTEQFLHTDPPREKDLASLRGYVAFMLRKEIPLVGATPARIFGAGGTITTAATLSLGLAHYEPAKIHGCVISITQVMSLTTKLSAMPLEARKKTPGLEKKRADIIVAGLVVLQCIMEFYGLNKITVSDEGILHGAILEAVGNQPT
jgi:exopolyphosphatase/guanosine-5'-triphosphate,3'-diphosphate pyrophosphatase